MLQAAAIGKSGLGRDKVKRFAPESLIAARAAPTTLMSSEPVALRYGYKPQFRVWLFFGKKLSRCLQQLSWVARPVLCLVLWPALAPVRCL